MSEFLSLLPVLVILACPLMMIFMMMGGHGHAEHGGGHGEGRQPQSDWWDRDERIAELEREVARLRAGHDDTDWQEAGRP